MRSYKKILLFIFLSLPSCLFIAWRHFLTSICVEDKFGNFKELKAILSTKFKVDFTENIILYNIPHFDEKVAQLVEENKVVILKQISRKIIQIVTKVN